MKTYRVDFKPVSPYFFGNEKTFPYTGQNIGQHLSNAYYIKSERMPSQTTVLGALRYLFLAHKKSNYTYNKEQFEENAKRVGEERFHIEKREAQDFGIIQSISSVFLYHDEHKILLPTPFDHNEKMEECPQKSSVSGNNEENGENNKELPDYRPFGNYLETDIPNGKKLYTADYDPKIGLTSSYMIWNLKKIVSADRIFSDADRVGIAVEQEDDSFFKKKYAVLAKGYRFSVYINLSDDAASVIEALKQSAGGTVTVFMGQSKSAFTVSFTEEENALPKNADELVQEKLPEGHRKLYFMSDALVSDSIELYGKTQFGVVKTKDYRAFGMTYQNNAEGWKVGAFQKEEELYKLIAAGSILITANVKEVMALFENPNAKKIGWNQILE